MSDHAWVIWLQLKTVIHFEGGTEWMDKNHPCFESSAVHHARYGVLPCPCTLPSEYEEDSRMSASIQVR